MRQKSPIMDWIILQVDLKIDSVPAKLACWILQNDGYVQGGAPRSQRSKRDFCDVYIGQRCVGRITYVNTPNKGVYAVVQAFGPVSDIEIEKNTLVDLARKLK